jgi:hypothetical protein
MREADIIITGCWRPHEADYPQQKNRRKTLYCIYDDSPASGHALDLAQTLALDSQHPLHVVCDSADHEQQVHAMLKPGLVNPITEVQPRPLALQSLSHTLSHHDAELLFIPLNRELALQQPQMRELLDHSHLPIVMVK